MIKKKKYLQKRLIIICEIEFTLKKTRILDEVNIKHLKNFLEKIYKKENNETPGNIIYNKQNLNSKDFKTNNTT